jgi:Zn-dependent M28 family amino/carboxypeptidase
MLILVSPEFRDRFQDLRHYFGARFTSNWKFTKVFVLGKTTADSYRINATQHIEPLIMTNVVGVLKGKKKADEMVVFSGHYDHIGLLQPSADGDSIANGADDDASGTTAVIELARYFKKVKKNKRTLIFVAFTAEEIGGYGSQYFSKQLDPEKVTAMFNIEMIGKPSKWGKNSAFITGFERSDFGAILQKNLEGTAFHFYPDPYPAQNLFYRSDNATLARLGVPAHTISTDQIDTDKLYHSVDDEFESMDIENITNAVRAIALSATTIISGKDTPKRIDKSKVH